MADERGARARGSNMTDPVDTCLSEADLVAALTTTEDVEFTIAGAQKLVVIRVFARWCGPCSRTAQPYRDIAERYKGRAVSFAEIDIGDDDRRVWRELGIRTVPTFIFARGRAEVGRVASSDMIDIDRYVKHNI